MEVDALFVNSAPSDYRVRDGSPAQQSGFQNFPMDQFGVMWPALKRIARIPEFPPLNAALPATLQSGRDPRQSVWLGAPVKNIGMGEVSASGLPGEAGVLVLDVPPSSRAAAFGLRKRDVVLRMNGKPVDMIRDLQQLSAESPAFGTIDIRIWRRQRDITLTAEGPVRYSAPSAGQSDFRIPRVSAMAREEFCNRA
jgi:S1-C subfamily serine protease